MVLPQGDIAKEFITDLLILDHSKSSEKEATYGDDTKIGASVFMFLSVRLSLRQSVPLYRVNLPQF